MKNNKKWYKENVLRTIKYNERNDKNSEKYQKAKNYVLTQRINIAILIGIVLILFIFLIFFYKPNSIDFLQEIKDTFTYGMIIILGIISICIILFNIFIKEKKILSNLLKITLLFNIIFLIIFLFMEANLNKSYNNEEYFDNIYETKVENKTDEKYVDIWNSILTQEMQTKTEKEKFIEENMSQFTYFRIRVYLILILYVITMMANTYLISKIDKEVKGQEILKKNDKLFFNNRLE